MYRARLAAMLAVAAGLHLLLAWLLARLPGQPPPPRPVRVEMRVVEAPKPPPPAPVPPPEPPKPAPPPDPQPVPQPVEPPTQPLELRRVQPQALRLAARADTAHDTPRSERAVTTGDSTDTPQFGFSLESTSEAGKGPAMPVGNTLMAPGGGPAVAKPKPLAAAVAARDVTKDPLPRGDCRGAYTDAARDAGIEGVVVLSAVIDAEGNARDITVIQKLGHGLDEAAVAALKACKFSPGEHNGQPVPVRIPRFKLRFVLDQAGE